MLCVLTCQETEEGRAALGPQISPIEHVTTSLPPIRIIHGDADMLVPLGQTRMVSTTSPSSRLST